MLSPKLGRETHKNSLLIARTTTFIFTLLTIIIALQYKHFGGVLGLIVMWFGALLGPIAVPMLLGLLPPFKRCNSAAAILSMAGGFAAFVLTKSVEMQSMALEVSLPLMVSLLVYLLMGLLSFRRSVPVRVREFIDPLFEKK